MTTREYDPPGQAPDAPLTAIARGSNRLGYVGVLVSRWNTTREVDVWSCDHRHPTTVEARRCAHRAAS